MKQESLIKLKGYVTWDNSKISIVDLNLKLIICLLKLLESKVKGVIVHVVSKTRHDFRCKFKF
ncbi:hypothetical protein PanWU01x14_269450 [Parasponia andersonii]|uniref:Uncharacterized protein n=1 Tax=Parasponia andersonii TaxID=3476 RepID=A0A2P5B5E9_PARAD|nr:hypothetical protein PanWU01x14_269450 [Parasponia andersonii]